MCQGTNSSCEPHSPLPKSFPKGSAGSGSSELNTAKDSSDAGHLGVFQRQTNVLQLPSLLSSEHEFTCILHLMDKNTQHCGLYSYLVTPSSRHSVVAKYKGISSKYLRPTQSPDKCNHVCFLASG